MRKVITIALAVLAIASGAWLAVFVIGSSRTRAEHEHGIVLPPSAAHIQCKGDAWRGFLDRGALTLFEMNTNDLSGFIAQLRNRSTNAPVRTGPADPTENGWNVWPKYSPTFVPGNIEYAGLRKTWTGKASPIEMLSCSSPKGDWLHVELWRLETGTILVKMYTDWN